jgi:hypothetical protein
MNAGKNLLQTRQARSYAMDAQDKDEASDLGRRDESNIHKAASEAPRICLDIKAV